MEKDAIKAIMHPVRMKIIQELGIRQQATTKEIQEACADTSQATLYRHLKSLLSLEIIEVVSENRINGIIEKVYGLKKDGLNSVVSDPKNLTKDDYLRLFSQYIISLLSDFSEYMNHKDALKDVANNIGFSSVSIYLTNEEMMELSKELSESIMKRIQNRAEDGRKLRKISHVVTTTMLNKS